MGGGAGPRHDRNACSQKILLASYTRHGSEAIGLGLTSRPGGWCAVAMNDTGHPILYSFRRCPYAMRARLALMVSGQQCELREVALSRKPAEMLAASPKGTVPVLILPDGQVLEQSLDIMHWALGRNDPHRWLEPETGDAREMMQLVAAIDGPFKHHLDRYKYAARYRDERAGQEAEPVRHREAAIDLLSGFEVRLASQPFLTGQRMSLADAATAPFVRQFAAANPVWFAAQPVPYLRRWLTAFLESDLLHRCMVKYPRWESGQPGVMFPG